MAVNNIHTRLAQKEEVHLLAAIQLEAATRFPDDILPEPTRSSYTVSAEIMDNAVAEGRLWVACVKDSLPLGYAVWREVGGVAILEQVDVSPAHGKRGIGSLLVRHVMAQAFGAGHSCLYLTTFSSVPWNAPFYMKLGFTVAEDEILPEVIRTIIEEERKVLKNRVPMRCALC